MPSAIHYFPQPFLAAWLQTVKHAPQCFKSRWLLQITSGSWDAPALQSLISHGCLFSGQYAIRALLLLAQSTWHLVMALSSYGRQTRSVPLLLVYRGHWLSSSGSIFFSYLSGGYMLNEYVKWHKRPSPQGWKQEHELLSVLRAIPNLVTRAFSSHHRTHRWGRFEFALSAREREGLPGALCRERYPFQFHRFSEGGGSDEGTPDRGIYFSIPCLG